MANNVLLLGVCIRDAFSIKQLSCRVIRASASGAVESDSIPSRVIPQTLKLVLTASLLDAHHYGDNVENETTNL